MVETCKQKQIKNSFKSRSMCGLSNGQMMIITATEFFFYSAVCFIRLWQDLQRTIPSQRKALSPADLNSVGLQLFELSNFPLTNELLSTLCNHVLA